MWLKIKSIRSLVYVCLCVFSLTSFAEEASDFQTALNGLLDQNFETKSAAISSLSNIEGDSIVDIFESLVSGSLFEDAITKKVYIADKAKNKYLEVVSSNELLTRKLSDSSQLKKIRINNKIRSELQQLSAIKGLSVKDVKKRRKTIRAFIKQADPEYKSYLTDALSKEEDKKAKSLLQVALSSVALKEVLSEEKKIKHINILAKSGEVETASLLESVVSNSSATKNEVKAANAAIKTIRGKKSKNKLAENLFFGLSLGSVLLLAAIGLAITFGVMGVINMAHGEMIMLGAYTTYTVQQLFPTMIEYSLWISIPAAFLVAGLVGVLIERLVIRHLYGRPLETLLATFGISLILQQAVRSIFSPLNRQVLSPEWMMGSLEVNSMLSLTYNRLYILIFSLLVLLFVFLLMRKTSLGLHMRAVTQNRAMANSMGIKSSRVDALTFGLGSGIAGIAGVALSQLTNVGPNLGQAYIIDSFMVVVFGGVGNLFGTLFAAMSLGVLTKFIEPFAGAVMAKILMLMFIILFIQWRPRGMFALKGRFVED